MTFDYANDLVLQFLADAREPHYPHLVDMADLLDQGPSDGDIVELMVNELDMTPVEAVERLARVDMAALREVVAP